MQINLLRREKYYLYFVMWLYLACVVKYYTNDILLATITIITGSIFVKYGLKIDKTIIIIVVTIFFINILSLVNGPIKISTFIGFEIRVILSYMLVRLLGANVINFYRNIGYFGAVLSIPMHIIELINPSLFKPFFFIPKLLGNEQRLIANYYDMIFHTLQYNSIERNAGFMWEPGAFAYVLLIAMIFEHYSPERKQYKIIVMFIVGLSTLSTTYFLCIPFLLVILFQVKPADLFLWGVVIVIGLFSINRILELDFIMPKIRSYFSTADSYISQDISKSQNSSYGRFIDFYVDIVDFFKFPVGHGVNISFLTKTKYGDNIAGPCGLSAFIRSWGILGIIFLRKSFSRFAIILEKDVFIKRICIISIFLIVMFSNPLSNSVTFLCLIIYPFYFRKTDVNRIIGRV